MEKQSLERFLNCRWLFLKRSNGFRYKARILSLTKSDITIIDRKGIVTVIDLGDIIECKEWLEETI